MKRVLSAIVVLAALFSAGLAPSLAQVQESYWVQLSANATLREAEDDARAYSARLPDVNGFRLGNSGWYAVALGPYSAEIATDQPNQSSYMASLAVSLVSFHPASLRVKT